MISIYIYIYSSSCTEFSITNFAGGWNRIVLVYCMSVFNNANLCTSSIIIISNGIIYIILYSFKQLWVSSISHEGLVLYGKM